MRPGLIISFSLHSAIMIAAFVGLPDPEKFKVKMTESIPVEILSVSEFNKLTPKAEDQKKPEKAKPKPKPKPAPKKKVVKSAPPPPKLLPKPPVPEVKKPPKPKIVEKKPEPKPALKPKPVPEKKVVEKTPPRRSVPVPKIRPKFAQKKPKKKSTFDLKKMAALVNKLPEDQAAEKQKAEKVKAQKTKSRLSGRDATISADEKDSFRRQVSECWNPPLGVKDAESLIVKIKIHLKRDGSLARAPEVMSSASDIAADSALRAVRRCEPYTMPAKKFDAWREIVLNFDPREMFGG